MNIKSATSAAASALSHAVDKAGTVFNQLKHIAKLHPVSGRWMPKGGRKPKPKMETPAAPSPSPSPTPTDPTPATPPTVEAAPNFADVEAALRSAPREDGQESTPDRAAELTAELKNLGDNPTAETVIGIIQTGLMMIGDEEGLLSPMEKEVVRAPLIRVLKKYQIGANVMPAEIDLALAVLGLFFIRLQKPKTATWFAKAKAWTVGLIFRRKGAQMAKVLQREAGPAVSPSSND